MPPGTACQEAHRPDHLDRRRDHRRHGHRPITTAITTTSATALGLYLLGDKCHGQQQDECPSNVSENGQNVHSMTRFFFTEFFPGQASGN